MSVFRDAELQGSAVAIVVLEIQWLMVLPTMIPLTVQLGSMVRRERGQRQWERADVRIMLQSFQRERLP